MMRTEGRTTSESISYPHRPAWDFPQTPLLKNFLMTVRLVQ